MVHRITPVLLIFFVSAVTANTATIQLPQTGQNKCYNTAGTVISCEGTGQDGDKQIGVAWDDATRFTNNGNGTITDTLTGLIWLQNANCTETVGSVDKSMGTLTWDNALAWSKNLSAGKCGLSDGSSAGQWRLPTRRELRSLVNRGVANSTIWLGTKGFNSVQMYNYWSSSTYVSYTTDAWNVYMSTSTTGAIDKTTSQYMSVWPVRGGQ